MMNDVEPVRKICGTKDERIAWLFLPFHIAPAVLTAAVECGLALALKSGQAWAVLFEQIIEILDPEPHDAPLNMAIDEALLQCAAMPTLRIYEWKERALSLGYFSRYAEAEPVAAGREMVRRWTGGGLVEHGEDITYTLIVPRDTAFFQHTPLESYRLTHEAVAEWLRASGIPVRVAPTSAEESSGACFAAHVRYDIVSGNRKLAGAAQRRTRWGLLHQGSILLPSVKTNRDLAGAFANNVERMSLSPEIIQAAQEIAEQRYATSEWLRKF
jgi:lipoate-protein ligase A